jgi:hypothetical protein
MASPTNLKCETLETRNFSVSRMKLLSSTIRMVIALAIVSALNECLLVLQFTPIARKK